MKWRPKMCIIAIAAERKLSEKELENCFKNNSDGAGIAWATPEGKVHVEKGFMTIEELRTFYASDDIPLPHVIHFRIATSGEVNREMTHPYEMTEKSELSISGNLDVPVLFHNGVIFDWKNLLVNMVTSKQIDAMPKGPMNDTRTAAIMASVPSIGDDILAVLSGKFVKVSPDGFITRWGDFEEVNGVYFSNDSYKRETYVYKNINYCYGANNNRNNNRKNRHNSKPIIITEEDIDNEYNDWMNKGYPMCQ